jgi:hypothetical protein
VVRQFATRSGEIRYREDACLFAAARRFIDILKATAKLNAQQ